MMKYDNENYEKIEKNVKQTVRKNDVYELLRDERIFKKSDQKNVCFNISW